MPCNIYIFGKKFDETWKNNDATALGALYTEDAVLVTDTRPVYGREDIQKHYSDLFKQVQFSNHISKRDQYSSHTIGTAGNEVWSNGERSLTYQVNGGRPIQLKSYWSNIQVREGDACGWELRGCLKSPDSRQILSSMCSLQLPESWNEAYTTFCELDIGRTFQTPSNHFRKYRYVWRSADTLVYCQAITRYDLVRL